MDLKAAPKPTVGQRLKNIVIGRSHNPHDYTLFHKLSLIAFFAWIGLGADALSSSSYGPEEAFLALGAHPYLGIFVALISAITIFVISSSYSQIIELFPSGGGGYLVATKLLSPFWGMISGCALIIDYIFTITISIAAGTAAVFSFLPPEFAYYRIFFAIFGVIMLIILNLRGVRESVAPLVPIFITFMITHLIVIFYALLGNLNGMPALVSSVGTDIKSAGIEIGVLGMIALVLHAYSIGAGTYTGIEAVSNSLPILREPRVKTGKRTMKYMAFSLAFMVIGLMLSYLVLGVIPAEGKTLNAVLFEKLTQDWGSYGKIFLFLTLFSEAALLFVAAQAGFFGGPRILANMALDKWLPARFASLSDRFVIQNGVLIMGIAAAATMIFTNASVKLLVVLYSINVFLTFVLSQLGMVRHWWNSRASNGKWKRKLLINGFGLVLTAFILASVVIFKFYDGGWATLMTTGALIVVVIFIKRHYKLTSSITNKLDSIADKAKCLGTDFIPWLRDYKFDQKARTAVILVKGFNGLGVHTLHHVITSFGGIFKNFIFVQIGAIDAGNFKGTEELEKLKFQVKEEANHYVEIMHSKGYYAEALTAIGIDVVEEVGKITPSILEKFPHAIFFGGQLVFPKDSYTSRLLHNFTVFAIQRKLYSEGIPLVLVPVDVH